jgi:hypothetical protein
MKIEMTPQVFRKMLSDLNKIQPYCVEGAPEDCLKEGLQVVANSLEKIQKRNGVYHSQYFLPSDFKLELVVKLEVEGKGK